MRARPRICAACSCGASRAPARSGPRPSSARSAIDGIVARLVGQNLLDDRLYAAQLAASLHRRGMSAAQIRARLAAKGVAGDDAKAALAALGGKAESELAAACVLVRRRRIGPFRASGDARIVPRARSRRPRPRRLRPRPRPPRARRARRAGPRAAPARGRLSRLTPWRRAGSASGLPPASRCRPRRTPSSCGG